MKRRRETETGNEKPTGKARKGTVIAMNRMDRETVLVGVFILGGIVTLVFCVAGMLQ